MVSVSCIKQLFEPVNFNAIVPIQWREVQFEKDPYCFPFISLNSHASHVSALPKGICLATCFVF